ncbi:MAG: hypothetical protein ACFFC1_06265 [Promethearchaeota archaeon]
MKNRNKKCDTCQEWHKLKNDEHGGGLCDFWDARVSSSHKACQFWKSGKHYIRNKHNYLLAS